MENDMSHQEKIERMNADLNTPATWSQRWQVEREHNERLLKHAGLARTGVQGLRARAIERYNNNQQYASDARRAEDPRKADIYERMCIVQSGMVRALDDVLQLFDQIEHIE
jgi:hypothetical protein